MIFFTATILNWQHALASKHCKQIIIDSLTYLVSNQKAHVYAFVIMPNHIHLLWQNTDTYPYAALQRDFKKFTAQQIKFYLQKEQPFMLERFISTQSDRSYQIWERRSKSISITTRDIAFQKLTYIHQNPVRKSWKLATDYQDYQFSSARYYECNEMKYSFLRHFMDAL